MSHTQQNLLRTRDVDVLALPQKRRCIARRKFGANDGLAEPEILMYSKAWRQPRGCACDPTHAPHPTQTINNEKTLENTHSLAAKRGL
jgi:hypothetical protein